MKELRGLCKVLFRRIGGREPSFLLPTTMEGYEHLLIGAKDVRDRRILAINESAEKIEAEANYLQLQADELVSSAREGGEAARELARREARAFSDRALLRRGQARDNIKAVRRAYRYSWMMPNELDPSYYGPPGLYLTCEEWAEQEARKSEHEKILSSGKSVLWKWQEGDDGHITRKYRVKRHVIRYSGQIFLFIFREYEGSSPRVHKAVKASMGQMKDEELRALAASEQQIR